MTQQEMIEQNVRLLLGDLQLQVVVLKARVAELEQEQKDRDLDKQPGDIKPNGVDLKAGNTART